MADRGHIGKIYVGYFSTRPPTRQAYFWAKSSFRKPKGEKMRYDLEVQFFFGKNIGTITKSGRSRQLYLSDLRNETRYHWVKQGEMLRWDKLYKKIR